MKIKESRNKIKPIKVTVDKKLMTEKEGQKVKSNIKYKELIVKCLTNGQIDGE